MATVAPALLLLPERPFHADVDAPGRTLLGQAAARGDWDEWEDLLPVVDPLPGRGWAGRAAGRRPAAIADDAGVEFEDDAEPKAPQAPSVAAAPTREARDAGLEEEEEQQLNPHERDAYGETPLHVAARHGHLDIVRSLVRDHQVTPLDVPNFEGWTPLCCALAHGRLDVAKLLLKSGAKPDHVTACGNTLLHLAAHHDQLDAVQWLLQHGMQADAKNAYALRPFDLAPPGPVRQALFEAARRGGGAEAAVPSHAAAAGGKGKAAARGAGA